MRFVKQKVAIYLWAALMVFSTVESRAFALLGPVEPWMQMTNGVVGPDDIGGPMNIDAGYRWNVPVVTYGFDASFLNYFGSNGVAAVRRATQILNNLPPASQMVLTNYPFDSQHENRSAAAQTLFDLKSRTLALLLEQLGLTQPARSIFVLRQFSPALLVPGPPYYELGESSWVGWAIPDYIVQRNFDPQTLLPTPYVNFSRYTGAVFSGLSGNYMAIGPVNSSVSPIKALADFSSGWGIYYNGLTYDDVGGLSFLLSTNNLNYETLLPGVVGVGANADSFVKGALRPGVDKVTFIPQPVNEQSGAFLPTTNYFTDSYLTNGILLQQQVARVVSQPDFLFSAGDVGADSPTFRFFTRTGTTNWLNHAAANGNPNGAGPGVIQPQVQIVFNKLGPLYLAGGIPDGLSSFDAGYWGSFDGTTNAPVTYPIPQAGTNQMVVRMWLISGTVLQQRFDWKLSSQSGTQFAMQTSTNLTDWATLFKVTNNGSVCTFLNSNPSSVNRFYRLIPSE